MERAINELQIKLDIYANNEPIWRAEGNEAQATICRESIESITKAIAKLQGDASHGTR